ncbi:hypothetical protein ACJ73_08215 [Blastomyces percursus]|uniref:Uncharacterized protein n=1 Tax=Blastomyces percursus TaxID=1658174 RepID=A0A1J9PVR2_9EURO|nr:hypothetical protein ACJ73_08215 [Blastomyces percursus]
MSSILTPAEVAVITGVKENSEDEDRAIEQTDSPSHLDNFLLRVPGFDNLSTTKLYERHGKPYEVATRRLDEKPSTPHAPPHVIYPMIWKMPANEVTDPEIKNSSMSASPPQLMYGRPLGVVLYDAVSERPLFETFAWDPDDIIAEMVNTLGPLPARWWGSWTNRSEFFNPDGSWIANFQRIGTPEFRRLHQRMWDMGRGVRRQKPVNGMLLAASSELWKTC